MAGLLLLIGQWASQAVQAAPICLGTLAAFIGWIWYRRSRVKAERTLLTHHPWQIWPCHLQALTANEARSLWHAAPPGTTACRVHLLAVVPAALPSVQAGPTCPPAYGMR
ncbi:hypothetical protein ACIQF6_28555 [Kitasatospora sp. NPDC092948]|uniref:hypothetical protein n=1 Tax=Kitasatospora sp. NPDC092948 TaxID=3364088 RepID=UPI003830A4CF